MSFCHCLRTLAALRPDPLAIMVLLSAFAGTAAGADPLAPTGRWTVAAFGDAPTPPMGWNSWNAFYTDIDEAKVIASAQAIVDSGLRDAGYRYVNIDDGWWRDRRQPDGRMTINTRLFPSAEMGGARDTSFRPFTDRLHAMGLRAGIYTDIGRNVCSQVNPIGNPNVPVGSVAEREVGLYDHVAQDIPLYFGAWGFDYIKVDGCGLDNYQRDQNPFVRDGTYREFPNLIVSDHLPMSNVDEVRRLYTNVRDEIARVRPRQDFVLSLCNWGTANVRAWGGDVGNLWRTSFDIAPQWTRMLHTFDTTVTRELYSRPGHWNDPDMLFIGHGAFDAQHLTEARSHFALWAIEDAPLIIGYDLRGAPRPLLDIWGNREIIAIDQDPAGNQGVLAFATDDLQIIVKQLSRRGEKAVAIFNRGQMPVTATLTADHLKMDPTKPVALRDLWAHADIGTLTGARDFTVAPRQTIMLRVMGTPALAGGTYLSEIPARVHVGADGIVALQADPHVYRMVEGWYHKTDGRGSQKVYAGWGAPRADATPYDLALSIGRHTFYNGIGALANSRLEVKSDAAARIFTADVGIDDSSAGDRATVRFEVYGDGRLLATTPPLAFAAPARHLSVPITGVKIVELVARQIGTDVAPVVVTWGNAALLD